MGACFHRSLDVEDLPIFPNVERGPGRILFASAEQPVGHGRDAFGIAQNGVVEFQRLGKFRVRFDIVTAGCEISDVVFPNFFATLTERLAFGRSSTGKGLGIPRHDHGLLAFVVGEFVGLAVTSRHGEVRRVITDSKVGAGIGGQRSHSEKKGHREECFFHIR